MIEIRLVSELAEAEKLWRALSPGETIYDLWDLRACFYRSNLRPLHFYTAFDQGEPVALLPLQYNADWGGLEFWAEEFSLSNRPFIKPGYEYLIPRLFNELPLETNIQDILGIDEFTRSLPLEDYRYYYDISGFKNFDDYLFSAFPNGRKRYNFKRLFTIFEKEHRIEVVYDDFSDLELLMDFNVKHFGAESYLRTEKERAPFRELLKLPLDWKMVTIIVGGVKLACSLAVVYQGTYYYLIVGSNSTLIRDVFKYLTKVNLELAIQNRAAIFDCALGDCNWKEFWHLSKEPQLEFVKKV